MIPVLLVGIDPQTSIPRESGDDPTPLCHGDTVQLYSPRERG